MKIIVLFEACSTPSTDTFLNKNSNLDASHCNRLTLLLNSITFGIRMQCTQVNSKKIIKL